jgi:hypothetical protein
MPVPGTVVLNGQFALLSQRQVLAANGSYFAVTNPTPGTAIAYANVVAFSATANGLFVVQNTGAKSIYLDYLYLRQTATAPTGTLSLNFDVWNETGLVAGTTAVATRTPVGINTGLVQTTGAVVQSFAAGAITIPAAVGTRRLQAIASIPTGVTVAHDSFRVDFGADGPGAARTGLTAARATDPATMCASAPPILVASGTTSWINMWWVTSAVNIPSFEFCLTFYEL